MWWPRQMSGFVRPNPKNIQFIKMQEKWKIFTFEKLERSRFCWKNNLRLVNYQNNCRLVFCWSTNRCSSTHDCFHYWLICQKIVETVYHIFPQRTKQAVRRRPLCLFCPISSLKSVWCHRRLRTTVDIHIWEDAANTLLAFYLK